MKRLNIRNSRGITKILIEDDYKYFRGLAGRTLEGRKVCIVKDLNAEACAEQIKAALKGYDVTEVSFGGGEGVKAERNFASLCELLYKNGFSRNDALIAVGGGAISDFTGFVASAYMRGIRYINCPTTLLASVDACVGGKTAVDIDGGKNIIGAFYPPAAVYISLSAVKNLPDKEILSGKGEIVKYALISDKISEAEVAGEITEDLVYKCLSIKKKFVEKDEFDKKERKILNLGHTCAHAEEEKSGFTLSHGECVARGLYRVIKASGKRYNLSDETIYEMTAILRAAGFGDEYKPKEEVSDISGDKKAADGRIDVILLKKRGKAKIENMPVKKAEELFS